MALCVRELVEQVETQDVAHKELKRSCPPIYLTA